MLTDILIGFVVLIVIGTLWFAYDLISGLMKATKQWDEERNKRNEARLKAFNDEQHKN